MILDSDVAVVRVDLRSNRGTMHGETIDSSPASGYCVVVLDYTARDWSWWCMETLN